MFMRWIWRGVAVFLARKAWEAFQRHQAGKRPPAQRVQPAHPARPAPRVERT
jgi:hypothetical protein